MICDQFLKKIWTTFQSSAIHRNCLVFHLPADLFCFCCYCCCFVVVFLFCFISTSKKKYCFIALSLNVVGWFQVECTGMYPKVTLLRTS